jgi:hypothetical protein
LPRSTPGHIIRLDLGGKIGNNPEVQAMFLKHGYILEPTGVGASSQRGSAERPHQTIDNDIQVMMRSADTPPKYWEYAFYLFLKIHAIFPHGEKNIPPYQNITLFHPYLSRLRMFGCRMFALPTMRKNGKSTTINTIQGKVIGWDGWMKNFIYVNDKTHKI